MRFSKQRRMTRSGEFRRVREEGQSFRGKYLVLGVLRDEALDGFKAGFITTRRLGKAVVRNRVRRRLRSLVVELGDRILPGTYLVTIARYPAAEASLDALRREWKWLGHRAAIFRKEEP